MLEEYISVFYSGMGGDGTIDPRVLDLRTHPVAPESPSQPAQPVAPGVTSITDTMGYGARGFLPHGPNKPYSTAIADEIERQIKVPNNFLLPHSKPALDPVATRFNDQAVAHFRPQM